MELTANWPSDGWGAGYNTRRGLALSTDARYQFPRVASGISYTSPCRQLFFTFLTFTIVRFHASHLYYTAFPFTFAFSLFQNL